VISVGSHTIWTEDRYDGNYCDVDRIHWFPFGPLVVRLWPILTAVLQLVSCSAT